MEKVKCYLKCVNGLHEPILLGNLQPIILGRVPETKIKDKRCSKKQVELTAYYQEYKVKYKHLGPNDGGLNRSFTKSGKVYELMHEDTFEFLYGKYPHKIVFEPKPPLETGNTDAEAMPLKKQLDTTKRKSIKSEEPSSKKLSVTSTRGNEWERVCGGDMLTYNQHSLKSDKIAAYDMDGTLITTASGRVFAKDINDWKILYAEVPGKLKQLFSEGYKIVIFTNQLGVSRGKITVKEIQTKIDRVMEKLGVPIQAFVSTVKGKYRKPVPGMWNFLVEECNGGLAVDKVKCLYVGDAAGRPEIPKQRKKDHSIADRLFALNIGIPFYTPEEHFLGHKPSSFKMPDFIPSELDSSISLYNPASTKVPNYPLEVILLVGFPGSGKSTFVEKHLLKLGYIPANRDSLGSWQKCVALLEKSLEERNHVVIDNTNPDKASRERYIEVSVKRKVPIRCFTMNVSQNHALHNNKFRELSESHHSKINDMVFNSYKSKYEQPSLKEGFSEIVEVNFLPFFKNAEKEELYKLFLLEK